MNFHHRSVRLFQALLVSAVLIAPAWGQIHKTIHALNASPNTEVALFDGHEKGSLVCQTLDHLGAGEALQTSVPLLDALRPVSHTLWYFIEQGTPSPFLYFAARAPPDFL